MNRLVESLDAMISKLPRANGSTVVDTAALRQDKRAMNRIRDLLRGLASDLNEDDWTQFDKENVVADGGDEGYVRNIIHDDKDNFVLKLLKWGGDALSPIHSHDNSECFVFVLKGAITEIQYDWDREEMLRRRDRGEQCFTKSAKPKQVVTLKAGQATDIDDFDAVHSVENADRSFALQTFKDPQLMRKAIRHNEPSACAYTLHLYIPNYSNPVKLKLPGKGSEDGPDTPGGSGTEPALVQASET